MITHRHIDMRLQIGIHPRELCPGNVSKGTRLMNPQCCHHVLVPGPSEFHRQVMRPHGKELFLVIDCVSNSKPKKQGGRDDAQQSYNDGKSHCSIGEYAR